VLPGVFTIGPKNDTKKAIPDYARRLLVKQHKVDSDPDSLDSFIKGIIEGETRLVAAKLSIEDIFSDRDKFKKEIVENVQTQLNDFGLQIHNANIKELHDAPGSKYFKSMEQKVLSEAETYAKISVAEAVKNADIGEKERSVETRKRTAELEMEAIKIENENRQKIEQFNSELATIKAENYKIGESAKITAQKSVEKLESELQMEVEQKKILQETERLRATEMSQTTVNAEKSIKESEGSARSTELSADATYYAKQKEAMGIKSVYEAQAEGISKLIGVVGNKETLMQYLMLNSGLYEKLAHENAQAIQGLNPKITIFGNNDGDAGSTIKNILNMLPPLATTYVDGQINKTNNSGDASISNIMDKLNIKPEMLASIFDQDVQKHK